MSMVLVYTSKIVNPIRQMPYQLDFNTNVIQIIGGYLYTAIDTLCDTDYKWVPLVPKANGYFNQMCHIYIFSAIALMFGIHAKIKIKNQFLGEMHEF